MKLNILITTILFALALASCDSKFVPKTADEIKYDARIKDRITSAQQMIDFRSAERVIAEKIQKLDAEKADFSKDPLWTHYEKDYNEMIQKLKSALEARK